MDNKTININNDPYYPSNQTKEFIEDNLIDFYEIENIDYVPIGTIVRYLIYNNNYHKYIIRMGGVMVNNNEDHICISSMRYKWRVPKQVKCSIDGSINKTRFFKIQSNDEKYEEALLQQEEEIENKDNIILEYKKIIISLKRELKYYKDLYSK